MIRGTTPTHKFELPFDTAMLKEIKIIYGQDDNVLFAKRLSDCDLDGNMVSVTLAQEDTLQFNSEKLVQIQIRALTINGDAPATKIMLKSVYMCLDDEVLV